MAMATAVTMAEIAGTGSMKKVIGTSSATAMVAVNPGTAPTNSPNAAVPSDHREHLGFEHQVQGLHHGVHGSGLPGVLFQHAPGERHVQKLIEQDVDEHRRDRGDDQRDPGPGVETPEQDQSRTNVTGINPMGSAEHDVKEQSDGNQQHVDYPSAVGPSPRAEPSPVSAQCRMPSTHENEAADEKCRGNHTRKQRGPVRLPVRLGEGLRVCPHGHGKQQQSAPDQGVVETQTLVGAVAYLAMPKAVMTLPRASSLSAIQCAN